MLNLAQESGATFTPFRRLDRYVGSRVLADTLFEVAESENTRDPDEEPASRVPRVITLPDRARFEAAIAEWFKDIRFDSFAADMKEHESFRAVVLQGYGVVPLIAAHLRRRPSFLFLALEEIFGEDPVPEESYGKLGPVTAAWLEWLQR